MPKNQLAHDLPGRETSVPEARNPWLIERGCPVLEADLHILPRSIQLDESRVDIADHRNFRGMEGFERICGRWSASLRLRRLLAYALHLAQQLVAARFQKLENSVAKPSWEQLSPFLLRVSALQVPDLGGPNAATYVLDRKWSKKCL